MVSFNGCLQDQAAFLCVARGVQVLGWIGWQAAGFESEWRCRHPLFRVRRADLTEHRPDAERHRVFFPRSEVRIGAIAGAERVDVPQQHLLRRFFLVR